MAPQLDHGDLNFDLNNLLRAPPCVVAALLFRSVVDAGFWLARAAWGAPLCSYPGPEGLPPSRIDGLLVDTRLAAPLRAAEVLPCGAIPGHTAVRFDLHLRVASRHVVKFVRPRPIELAPLEEHQRLLLVNRHVDPSEVGWRTALATGDVDRACAFLTTAADETLLALSCPDVTPDTLPGAALRLNLRHLPRGKGTNELLCEVRLCPKERRDTGGPLTCPLLRFQAAQVPLWEVLRSLEWLAHGVGALPHRVQQARGHSGTASTGSVHWGRPTPASRWAARTIIFAPLEPLRCLCTTLVGMALATLPAADKQRPQRWHAWLQEAWSFD